MLWTEANYQKVKALNVTLKDRILYLVVDSARDVSLELGLLKDKKEFFEEVFWNPACNETGREEDNGGGFCMKFKEFDKPEYFVNRELSWIKFDDRVLSEARDKNLPLFERLKFLSITSSNLDEFYMVRVASLKDQVHAGYKKTDIAGMTAKEQLKAISRQTHDLVHVQYSTLNRSLVPALEKAGLHVSLSMRHFPRSRKNLWISILKIMYIRS